MLDVLIVGGGPAGAATAIALARHGLRAAIVERNAAPPPHPGPPRPGPPRPGPPRVGETLPPAVRNPLESLGLWQRFLADGHDPAVGNRSSWGSERIDEIHFIRNAYGHGWHIDRQKFDSMLLEAARACGVAVFAGAPIDSWQRCDGHTVTIGARTLRAPFAVDASGRASFLARISGAERIAIDHLVASTMFLAPRAADPQQMFTLIEAVEDGWWYSASLPGGRLVASFMTDAASLRTREEWLEAARRTRVTCERIAAYAPAVDPQIAAAGTSRLTSVVGPDWLAVGDAAVSFDPLSSQGIMIALESALDAASAIADRGDAALSRYASAVTGRYRQYLVDRARYYGAERRWPDAPFWNRRHLHYANAS